MPYSCEFGTQHSTWYWHFAVDFIGNKLHHYYRKRNDTNLIVDPICSNQEDYICNNQRNAEINQNSCMMRLQLSVTAQHKLTLSSCYINRPQIKNNTAAYFGFGHVARNAIDMDVCVNGNRRTENSTKREPDNIANNCAILDLTVSVDW